MTGFVCTLYKHMDYENAPTSVYILCLPRSMDLYLACAVCAVFLILFTSCQSYHNKIKTKTPKLSIKAKRVEEDIRGQTRPHLYSLLDWIESMHHEMDHICTFFEKSGFLKTSNV